MPGPPIASIEGVEHVDRDLGNLSCTLISGFSEAVKRLGWSQQNPSEYLNRRYGKLEKAEGITFRIVCQKDLEAEKKADKRVYHVVVSKEVNGGRSEYRERIEAKNARNEERGWKLRGDPSIPEEWLCPPRKPEPSSQRASTLSQGAFVSMGTRDDPVVLYEDHKASQIVTASTSNTTPSGYGGPGVSSPSEVSWPTPSSSQSMGDGEWYVYDPELLEQLNVDMQSPPDWSPFPESWGGSSSG